MIGILTASTQQIAMVVITTITANNGNTIIAMISIMATSTKPVAMMIITTVMPTVVI